LGSLTAICRGTTSANLPYSGTTESPDLYSINYSPLANTAGFIDVFDASLPVSPITLVIPGSVPTGVYIGYLTVKNSGTGLSSSNYVVQIVIIDVPGTPVISGEINVPENSEGFVYSTGSVSNATYNWNLPSGWSITDGDTTNKITVTTGSLGQDGDITVTVANSCDTSAPGSLTVTVSDPTDHTLYNCSSCHILHNAPGSTMTSVSGNALLCQSCHTSTGAASAKPLINADNGVSSHAWDSLAVNTSMETDLPLDSQMAMRIVDNKIICSTCHDQHNTSVGSPHLRVDNTGDALCKDCHRARDLGRYTDAPSTNKGSHPVGITYNGSDSRFNSAPTNTQLVGGNVECSSCHGVHDVDGSKNLAANGNLLLTTNDADLCKDCHAYGDHNAMDCLDCHQVHNAPNQYSNIYMIRDSITNPTLTTSLPVIFTSRGTDAGGIANKSFADGDTTYDGVCEVCHSNSASSTPNHPYGSPPDPADNNHYSGQNCTVCHPHESNFARSGGDCVSCHQSNFPTWNVTDGHVAHTTKYSFSCSTCHFERGSGTSFHENGTADVNFDPNGLARRNGQDINTPVFNGDSTCDNIYCHSDGQTSRRSTNGTYTWSGFALIDINSSYLTTPNWDTGSITDCNLCHPGPTSGGVSGPIIGTMDSPYLIYSTETTETTRPDTGTHNSGNHHDNDKGLSGTDWVNVQCFWCHKADDTYDAVSGTTDNNAQYQGTYGIGYDGTGTILHVDGETQFDPRQYSNGGTFPDNNTYAADATAPHCGNPKSCW
jgi:predicted CxxxxCH...CXXCH cytochrome family protein